MPLAGMYEYVAISFSMTASVSGPLQYTRACADINLERFLNYNITILANLWIKQCMF